MANPLVAISTQLPKPTAKMTIGLRISDPVRQSFIPVLGDYAGEMGFIESILNRVASRDSLLEILGLVLSERTGNVPLRSITVHRSQPAHYERAHGIPVPVEALVDVVSDRVADFSSHTYLPRVRFPTTGLGNLEVVCSTLAIRAGPKDVLTILSFRRRRRGPETLRWGHPITGYRQCQKHRASPILYNDGDGCR